MLTAGPEAGEGRRSSSLTEDTSPDARLAEKMMDLVRKNEEERVSGGERKRG